MAVPRTCSVSGCQRVNDLALQSRGIAATHRWRQASAILLVAAFLVALANADALVSLIASWRRPGHGSGFLVPLLSAWLIWRERARLRALAPQPDARALLAAAVLGGIAWLAVTAGIQIVWLATCLASFAALVWAVAGFTALRVLAYPILVSFLALPVWGFFTSPLQWLTVHVAAFVVELLGTPVLIDETYLHVPGGTFVVLAECSGVQFFHAAALIGALHAGVNFISPRMRAIVLAAVVGAGILGNWMRVTALVYLGDLGHFEHLGVGWITFAAVLLPVLWLTLKLQRRDSRLAEQSARRQQEDFRETISHTPAPRLSKGAAIASAATLLLVLGPQLALGTRAPLPQVATALPPLVAGAVWSGPHESLSSWHPTYLGADAQSLASYRHDEFEVAVYRAYYASQRQGAEVVNDRNAPYDPAHWVPRGGDTGVRYVSVPLGSERPFTVMERRLQSTLDGTDRLVWQWYCVAGRPTAKTWKAKLFQVIGSLTGRHDAAVIAISAAGRDTTEVRAGLRRFLLTVPDVIQSSAPACTRG